MRTGPFEALHSFVFDFCLVRGSRLSAFTPGITHFLPEFQGVPYFAVFTKTSMTWVLEKRDPIRFEVNAPRQGVSRSRYDAEPVEVDPCVV